MAHQFIAYFRVSTQRQGQSGLGLEAQREIVSAYVRGIGGTVIAEHTEVESGKVRERPVLQQALGMCRQANASLVIAKLDRLSRSVAFISSIMEAKVEFVAVDMPHANKLLLHVMAAFAEHEREQISSRTKAALAAAKARGVKLGTYGRVLADQNKVQARNFALSLRDHVHEVLSDQPKTLGEIAEGLNARHVRSREGSRWHPASVARLLSRLTEQPAVAEWQARGSRPSSDGCQK